MKKLFFLLILMPGILIAQVSHLEQSDRPPVIPVGEDAYLMWDKLPYQRIGVRAYMRSTYDREGNNRAADASHYLYQENDTFNVALDIQGNGVLYFVRTNHFHGSPWHYETDGKDFIVKETATDDPVNAKEKYKHTEFIPQNLFPFPLTYTWSITKGADLMWRPISFENSFRLAYERTFYGTGYYIYHIFPKGIQHVSQPIRTWDKKEPSQAVLDLLKQSGNDIAPTGKGTRSQRGSMQLRPFERKILCQITKAPLSIRAIKFRIKNTDDYDFGKCRLIITWDNRQHASIDAPVDLFFGTGQLYNDNGREFLVKGFPLVIRYDKNYVYLDCYWPMPFFRNAKIELEERNGKTIDGIQWEIRTIPFTDPINHATYFHATYTDHLNPETGKDITFLDTKNVEGSSEWSGHFAGMSWSFTDSGHLGTLEGDPRFFFDDSRTPQGWGTGTEEWGGGGDYWGGENMTIPFAGHPIGKEKQKAENPQQLINSAYRFLIADIFPFGKRAVINLEHGGINTYPEHYSGVVYWYGVDVPSLILTDEFNVCNDTDCRKHNYYSPTSEKPYALLSRYELGPDHDEPGWSNPSWLKNKFYGSRMFFPAEQDSVRTMTGISQFTVDIDPFNLGVLIRRKFDYAYPNQNARVFVRKTGTTNWNDAGTWYTAGSNTCVYSRPEGKNFSEKELAPAEHKIITGNRRWREEELLISEVFTKGVNKLDIKIEFIPNTKSLFPGQPFPVESKWSESRYWVYCYKLPLIKIK